MRISDWSSDVCSSDLAPDDSFGSRAGTTEPAAERYAERISFDETPAPDPDATDSDAADLNATDLNAAGPTTALAPPESEPRPFTPTELASLSAATPAPATRSEEHTSELQSLMRISYAVFGLKKKHK